MTPAGDPARRAERGQASVELALVLPVVAALTVLLAQVGLLVKDYVLVVHAAREGLRAAVVDPSEAAATHAIERVMAGPTGPARGRVDVEVRRRGELVTVAVSYRGAVNVPFVARNFRDFPMKVQVTGRVED